MSMHTNKYIDLHCHMDGAITVDIAKKLAKLQNIELPQGGDEVLKKMLVAPADCKDLNDFLKCFDFPCSLLQTKEGIREAVYLVLEEQKKNGAIYVELRYAPQLLTLKGLTQEDVVLAALEGLKKSSLKANLILCFMRGEGNEKENEETLELAKKYLAEDGGVVALDIAGAEALFTTSKYRNLFAKAKDYGIPFTIHAGEADGPMSVKEAIEYGAKRIGHGVRTAEDEAVLKLAKETGVTFEMCPTSNFQTRVVDKLEDYPLIKYMEYGIKVTLNTDDPAIEGTNISQEYSLMEQSIGLTPEHEKILLSNAINAAFTTKNVKDELRKELAL